MGRFSEKFRLGVRLRQADFSKDNTKEHWLAWAKIELKRNGLDKIVEEYEVKQKTISDQI
jgi:hypothetical protein